MLHHAAIVATRTHPPPTMIVPIPRLRAEFFGQLLSWPSLRRPTRTPL
jgi:hypothetical protein